MRYQIIIRRYKNTDCQKVSELFYETVHHVNAQDYTDEQLFAWAKDIDRLKNRRTDLLKQNTLVAEINGSIVGFGSITAAGCLDLLYVHKDFLRQGIATKLCDELEKYFTVVIAYVSLTAKPFFETRGYYVIKEQEVERLGVKLKNYKMKKIFKCNY